MLEMRGMLQGRGKDAETIGIEVLGFLAGDQEFMQRFLDLNGIEPDQVCELAAGPSVFVDVLDFVLAEEPTREAVSRSTGLGPWELGVARDSPDFGPNG